MPALPVGAFQGHRAKAIWSIISLACVLRTRALLIDIASYLEATIFFATVEDITATTHDSVQCTLCTER